MLQPLIIHDHLLHKIRFQHLHIFVQLFALFFQFLDPKMALKLLAIPALGGVKPHADFQELFNAWWKVFILGTFGDKPVDFFKLA